MKNAIFHYFLMPLFAALVFSSNNDLAIFTLIGEVTVTPSSATVGTKLTAKYSGSEDVLYSWYRVGEGTGVAWSTTTYTPTAPGEYYVSVSTTSHHSKRSNTVTVKLYDVSENITISLAGPVPLYTELTANHNEAENAAFQWYKDGTEIPGATENKYTPLEFGRYSVIVSVPDYGRKRGFREVDVIKELSCPNYYGTWRSGDFFVIITADTVAVSDQDGLAFKITNTTWLGSQSQTGWEYYEEYPQYFNISGTIDPSSREEWRNNGRDRMPFSLYIHKTDRQKMLAGIKGINYVFDKQP